MLGWGGVGWGGYGSESRLQRVTTPGASSLKKLTYNKTRSGHANAIGIQTIKSVFHVHSLPVCLCLFLYGVKVLQFAA